jgi:hypothetical protein
MKDFDLVEMSEEMLHEVVGARAASIRCGADETLTVTPNSDGSTTYTCD